MRMDGREARDYRKERRGIEDRNRRVTQHVTRAASRDISLEIALKRHRRVTRRQEVVAKAIDVHREPGPGPTARYAD